MSKMRFKYRVWLAIIVIIAALLFAWWASGEVYRPEPTNTPTRMIPTSVTAAETDHSATATVVPTTAIAPTVTMTVMPTETSTPQPTITAAETEHSATTIPTAAETEHSATLAPTATPKAVYEQPDHWCEMLVYKHNRAIYYPYCWEWLK